MENTVLPESQEFLRCKSLVHKKVYMIPFALGKKIKGGER